MIETGIIKISYLRFLFSLACLDAVVCLLCFQAAPIQFTVLGKTLLAQDSLFSAKRATMRLSVDEKDEYFKSIFILYEQHCQNPRPFRMNLPSSFWSRDRLKSSISIIQPAFRSTYSRRSTDLSNACSGTHGFDSTYFCYFFRLLSPRLQMTIVSLGQDSAK